MDDREFCKKIVECDGSCMADKGGLSPWGRTCSKEQCPIYQEVPCSLGKAVVMANEWLAANQEAK